jgi:hypothetical protein
MEQEWRLGWDWQLDRSSWYWCEFNGDPIRSVDEPAGGYKSVFQNLLTDVGGTVEDDRGLLKSRERATGEVSEPPRTRLFLGFQDRAKGIEIVAIDTGPTGRNDLHEMSVAVVRNMDEVHTPGSPSHGSRQAGVTVQEAIGVEPGATKDWELAKEMEELGSDFRNGEARREVREELVGAEIHARPPLGAEITDNAQSKAHRGFRQMAVKFNPYVVRLHSDQSLGTGGASLGHIFASSTRRNPPSLTFLNTARIQFER